MTTTPSTGGGGQPVTTTATHNGGGPADTTAPPSGSSPASTIGGASSSTSKTGNGANDFAKVSSKDDVDVQKLALIISGVIAGSLLALILVLAMGAVCRSLKDNGSTSSRGRLYE